MRHGGIFLGYLALLTLFSCSSAEPPPPEGSLRSSVYYSGAHSVNISGNVMPNMDNSTVGDTVLEGRDGFRVSCTVTAGGAVFDASITAPNGENLQVTGRDVGAQGARISMYFTVYGEPNVVSDTQCALTTIQALEAGSIWAKFQCDNIAVPSIQGTTPGSANGEFVFTGCKR